MSDMDALVEKAAAVFCHSLDEPADRGCVDCTRSARAALLAVGLPALLERVEAAEEEVTRLRVWQRRIADAASLSEVIEGHGYVVHDATDSAVVMIEETFERSLYHADCERVSAEGDALAAKVAAVKALAIEWVEADTRWPAEYRYGAFAESLRAALDVSETQ